MNSSGRGGRGDESKAIRARRLAHYQNAALIDEAMLTRMIHRIRKHWSTRFIVQYSVDAID